MDPLQSTWVAPARFRDIFVLGVVARDPALTLGVPSPDSSPIAYSGRVYVKAIGPIAPGDPLASYGSGYAYRASTTTTPNLIFAKALQALDAGYGEILVLLAPSGTRN
jgi:hypothetical protein